MTKKQTERMNRLMPYGKPKYIRVYDNDGETADRYTVVFTGNYGKYKIDVCMSGAPFHPQGVCLHGASESLIDARKNSWGAVPIGKKNHLGKRITFEDLPDDCKKVVISDYKDLWSL